MNQRKEAEAAMLIDLKVLVESTTRGDPESPLLWTARSQRNLAGALAQQGHRVGKGTVACLLKQLGLQGTKKCLEGDGMLLVPESVVVVDHGRWWR